MRVGSNGTAKARDQGGATTRKRWILSGDEFFVLVIAVLIAVTCTPGVLGWWKHRLYLRRNAAAALPVLAVLAGLGWIGYVLRFHADPSVTGIYTFFYFVLGMAVMVGPAFWALYAYGLRVSVDVFERQNMAVSIVVSAFVISTGLIYGGSNWGAADPTGDSEGGWWIPVGFFVAGWLALLLISGVYIRREKHSLRARLVQDRRQQEAWSAASFLIGNAAVLTHAVAGDFWGWTEGLLGVGAVALMVITHDLCRRAVPVVVTTVEEQLALDGQGRWLESIAYVLISLIFWLLSRVLGP